MMNFCYHATQSNLSDLSGSNSSDATSSGSSFTGTSRSTTTSSESVPRRMDLSDLDMIKLINTGGNGKVYLVRDRITDQHLALKIIRKFRNVFSCNTTKVTAERDIHAFLTMQGDDFVLPLVATWSDDANFYLASEYIPGGDLALRMMQQRTFDEAVARFYVAELIVALERLHARKIIHRDIKPSNVLIRPDGHLVVADFGVSKRFPHFDEEQCVTDSESQYSSALQCIGIGIEASSVYSGSGSSAYMTSDDCGTSYFMSPEQHRGDQYSFEVDYWAVGVILYRMVTGKMPFGDSAMHKGHISRSVLEDDVVFDERSQVSTVTRDFILGLLAKDPCHRLHPSEIRSDPFFDGVNWSAVENREIEAPWLPFVAPIPKYTRTILPGYRECMVSYADDISSSSFAWYSPYARLRHVKSLGERPRLAKISANAISYGSISTSASASSFVPAFESRLKGWSWVRAAFCGGGGTGRLRKRRRKGWVPVA